MDPLEAQVRQASSFDTAVALDRAGVVERARRVHGPTYCDRAAALDAGGLLAMLFAVARGKEWAEAATVVGFCLTMLNTCEARATTEAGVPQNAWASRTVAPPQGAVGGQSKRCLMRH
jgi:hypothetical protein